MSLSAEAIIGLVALLVMCFPSLFCLYRFIQRRSLRNGNLRSTQQRSILPTTTAGYQILYAFQAASMLETGLIHSNSIPLGDMRSSRPVSRHSIASH